VTLKYFESHQQRKVKFAYSVFTASDLEVVLLLEYIV
jgi:hypothetical protein